MKRRAKTKATGHPLLRVLQEAMYADPRTQAQLMLDSGVADKVWQKWFNGGVTPRLTLLEALANTLGYRLILIKDDQHDQRNPQGRTTNGPDQPVVRHERTS